MRETPILGINAYFCRLVEDGLLDTPGILAKIGIKSIPTSDMAQLISIAEKIRVGAEGLILIHARKYSVNDYTLNILAHYANLPIEHLCDDNNLSSLVYGLGTLHTLQIFIDDGSELPEQISVEQLKRLRRFRTGPLYRLKEEDSGFSLCLYT